MIELIPAIDIIDGRCVRLSKGDYDACTRYSDNPVDVAQHFEQLGLRRLHVVDLDGAKEKHCVNLPVLEKICAATNLEVDFGGGVKSEQDLLSAFSAGASMVTVGSVAATQPDLVDGWIASHSANRFILGADICNGRIRTHGWLRESGVDLADFIARFIKRGVSRVLCTDISKDGMLSGPNIELYRDLMKQFPGCHLIASGGVSCTQDILELQKAGIPAVGFGKAFYEGRLDLPTLIQQLSVLSSTAC